MGDVGFILEGQFHLLFSAGLEKGTREPGVDIPDTFEQLIVGKTRTRQPRDPGCVAAQTSRKGGAGFDVSSTSFLCVISLGPSLPIFNRALPRPIQPNVKFSFQLTGIRGAALTTRDSTYNEDSLSDSTFRKYTKRHYESWVKFAGDKGYGENLRPVLVSGFDMAKDFAMAAYSNNSASVQAGAGLSLPMFVDASASAWGEWRTERTPFVNHGPQQVRPPDLPLLLRSEPESPSTEYKQCVFLRYYTMRLILGFPIQLRAAAGPHDLGSGGNRGSTSRSDAESRSVDEDPGGQWDIATNDTESELDVVVRNVSYVQFLAHSSVSALTIASRMKSTTVGMPSQTICSM